MHAGRGFIAFREVLGFGQCAGQFGFPHGVRRLFGPHGGAARQDVWVAKDMDASSEKETDFQARAAHRKAKEKSEKKKGGVGDGGEGANKVNGGRADL